MKFFTNWIESMVAKVLLANFDINTVTDLVAEKIAMDHKGVDLGKLSREIDLSDLAQQFDTDDIAREIGKGYDIDEDKVAEKIADDISYSDIAEKVAENIDADDLDYKELAKALLREFAAKVKA